MLNHEYKCHTQRKGSTVTDIIIDACLGKDVLRKTTQDPAGIQDPFVLKCQLLSRGATINKLGDQSER